MCLYWIFLYFWKLILELNEFFSKIFGVFLTEKLLFEIKKLRSFKYFFKDSDRFFASEILLSWRSLFSWIFSVISLIFSISWIWLWKECLNSVCLFYLLATFSSFDFFPLCLLSVDYRLPLGSLVLDGQLIF